LGETVPAFPVPGHHGVTDGAVAVDEEERRDSVDAERVGCRIRRRFGQGRHLLAVAVGVGLDGRRRVLAHGDDVDAGVGERLHLRRRHLAHRARRLEEREHDRAGPPRIDHGFAARSVG
jgi:hypothetical protein